MSFVNSIWWPITVGAVYITIFILSGANMFSGIVLMMSLSFSYAMQTSTANMWRKTAQEIGRY